MPIIKKISGHARPAKIMNYIKNPEKTNKGLMIANNCSINNPERDFEIIQKLYGKCQDEESRKYHHVIVSFNTIDEAIKPEEIKDMVQEWIDSTKIRDYQYLAAVHTDKPSHLHMHIVINNVSMMNDEEYRIKEGKSFQLDKKELKDWMTKANEISKEHGYEKSVVCMDREPTVRMASGEAQMILKRNEVPWKEELRNQISECAISARNEDDFIELMNNEYGVEVTVSKKGEYKYLPSSFEERGGKVRACGEKRLGEAYRRENILSLIKEREDERAREQNRVGEEEERDFVRTKEEY